MGDDQQAVRQLCGLGQARAKVLGIQLRCHGTSQYVVKVGTAGARTGRFEWIFRMRKLGNLWKIDGLTAFDQTTASRDQQ